MDFKKWGMSYPGMWHFPINSEHCCIYRVPNCIRQVNPEAYTPQLVIIGPLHHSLKDQAVKSLGDIKDSKSMGYLNMEAHKRIYLAEFAKRVEGEKTIDEFRRMIKEDEEKIRESYSESTAWIKSPDFVEMILHDSVFILLLLLGYFNRLEANIVPCLQNIAKRDLILLENQLPYFILEKLFKSFFPRVVDSFIIPTFRDMVLHFFGFEYRGNNSRFKHFTDLVRCVYLESLPTCARVEQKHMEHLYNANKLESRGLKFLAIKEDFSLNVRYKNGCLKMPWLTVDDNLEMTMRNIMAFEQCHDFHNTHVCAYINFLDHLIDTEKDVDFLVEKGIIKNSLGQHKVVAKMVNKLCLGIVDFGSYYQSIAVDINAYYSNPFNKSRAILKDVYFGDLWTGTGTVAAMLLLVMTLIQTVASIIQVMQNSS